ncbi:unnamed protein product [Dracunculus medinensis]|uniref:RUN domain-containing protein n=1 Tax=Dracunculus medinensis TaxID=318479 RepID=A0A0N4U8G1_DRAME|nr:unnamed protein product [Dracunculus medinensis]
MSKNNIKITTEIEQNSIYPARSVKPNDLSHLQHCVAYNIVVSTLLQQKNLNNLKTEATVEQIATDVLSCLLERMRMDGLISRTRLCNDEDVTVAWTCQTSVSHYFRHFFNHRFHQEIVEQMDQVYHNIDSGEKIEEDSAGAAAAYASCFYKNVSNSFMLFAKTSLNK